MYILFLPRPSSTISSETIMTGDCTILALFYTILKAMVVIITSTTRQTKICQMALNVYRHFHHSVIIFLGTILFSCTRDTHGGIILIISYSDFCFKCVLIAAVNVGDVFRCFVCWEYSSQNQSDKKHFPFLDSRVE